MGSVCGWLAGDWPSMGGVLNITAAAWTAGFHWWRSRNIMRTQNVNEYMLVLALCLVLLVPEHTDTALRIEFKHTVAWANANNLRINFSKTKETVYRWPTARYFHIPPAVEDTEQLERCKLTGPLSRIFKDGLTRPEHPVSVCSAHKSN